MTDAPKIENVLPKKPEAYLTVLFKGERRELFMSFQRLNSLLRDIEDPRRILQISVDPDLGEAVLRVCLAPTSVPGAAFEFELVDDMISNEDVELILDWAADHLVHFFLTRFHRLAQKAALLEPIAKALQSSQPGSGDSTLPIAAAGPSE